MLTWSIDIHKQHWWIQIFLSRSDFYPDGISVLTWRTTFTPKSSFFIIKKLAQAVQQSLANIFPLLSNFNYLFLFQEQVFSCILYDWFLKIGNEKFLLILVQIFSLSARHIFSFNCISLQIFNLTLIGVFPLIRGRSQMKGNGSSSQH